MDDVQLLEFGRHGDERGQLTVIEGAQSIPFEIKRLFYVYGVDGEAVRGKHANRRSAFVMVAVAGSCRIRVKDPWGGDREFALERPQTGLYIPPMLWKDMYGFRSGSVLLVLSNEHYDADEYIRDFESFRSNT